MGDANSTTTLGRRTRPDALHQGSRKKIVVADPLLHHGRHFGRTSHTFCNVNALLANGLLRLIDPDPQPLETQAELREDRVFKELLKQCPGLDQRLMRSSEEEVGLVADLIQKGVNAARADDTKGLKAAIIDWIAPPGQSLEPPINRKLKSVRGFHHERTGALLCPAELDWPNPSIKEKLRSGEMQVRGDQWPVFLYADLAYDSDDPWNGLLRNQLLITAYKHIFTSPSSVDQDEPRATRAGNAYLHGMVQVTKASLAYVSTQVRFALCSSSTFSRTDAITDSETFYNSILDLLEDPHEQGEVQELLSWWNRKVFPFTHRESTPTADSAFARIKEKRRQSVAPEELADS